MVSGCARRGSPTPTRPAPGRPPAPGGLPRTSRRWPRTAFWVGALLQQLGGPPVHRQLSLELADALTGSGELAALARRQAGFEPPIDPVLAPPVVHRLLGDAKVLTNLCHATAGFDQIQHPTAKLRRVSPSPHVVLLEDNSPRV